ncbi:MAG: Zn-dependent hydrolase [Candidatus Dormibacteraeota bacterium]|nr:Zn-dependent hydrolase [Candidatus Dormibacteraeota bacterium]
MEAGAPAAAAREDWAERTWDTIMTLAEFVEPGTPGWTRRVFSAAYQESRRHTRLLMKGAGLTVVDDAAGNLIGTIPGSDPRLPALVVGSHTDTVLGGGRFDGMLGVAAAIEVGRRLVATGPTLRHPLRVVDFTGEEPNAFGISCLGSRAVTGHLTPSHLALRDISGNSLGEALKSLGARPAELGGAVWAPGSVHAYLELHIEQASRLERARRPLGVVTAIAGISRAAITLTGRADHAGTTPMGERQDALQAAAEVITGIDALGRAGRDGDGVATAGRITVEPNSPNVVPSAAVLVAEMRSTEADWLRERSSELTRLVDRVASRRSVRANVEWISQEPPVPTHPALRRALAEAVADVGAGPLEVPSWASHDAAHIARLAPMGMLFIPSREGRSHCPEEWSDRPQVALGALSLLAAVRRADDQDF